MIKPSPNCFKTVATLYSYGMLWLRASIGSQVSPPGSVSAINPFCSNKLATSELSVGFSNRVNNFSQVMLNGAK